MKRILDFLVSIVVIVILFPLFIVLPILIVVNFGRPIIFKQRRPGLNGKIFYIYKFRTMTEKKDSSGKLLSDEERLTRFGKFLRSTSLDELPGLICVLTGKMSLVGPRPLLVEYLELYNEQQARRHEVKPGVTGWAQVNGRNNLSWEDRFNLDVWYVENQSFLLDLKILLLTFKKVIIRDGISSENHATMPAFKGSNNKSGIQ